VSAPEAQQATAMPSNEALQKQMEQAATTPVSMTPMLLLNGIIKTPTGLIILLLIVLTLAIFWKVFEKAGEPGWKGIIPVYNLFVLVKISGNPWWWSILLFVPLVGFVIAILYNLALSKRFGKGPVFGLGLCFFPMIFFPILAFGDAEYN
jgi:hypothetical protein